jgi:hypothetical protein
MHTWIQLSPLDNVWIRGAPFWICRYCTSPETFAGVYKGVGGRIADWSFSSADTSYLERVKVARNAVFFSFPGNGCDFLFLLFCYLSSGRGVE